MNSDIIAANSPPLLIRVVGFSICPGFVGRGGVIGTHSVTLGRTIDRERESEREREREKEVRGGAASIFGVGYF